MNWLSNINIRYRLWLLTCVFIIIMIFVGIFGMTSAKHIQNYMTEMYENPFAHTRNVGQVINAMQQIRQELLLLLQHNPEGQYAAMHDHGMEKHFNRIEGAVNNLKSSFKLIEDAIIEVQVDGEEGAEAKYIKQIAENITIYLQQGVQPVIEIFKKNEFIEADKLILLHFNSSPASYFGRLNLLLQGFVDFNDEEAQELFERSENDYQSAFQLLIMLIAMGIVLGFTLSWLIIKGIDTAVSELHDVASEYAKGDLSGTIRYSGQDELGRVCEAFNKMGEQFRQLLSEITQSVHSLASASQETSSVTIKTQQGLRDQQDKTAEVTLAMNNMSSSMSTVKNNADQAAQAAKICNQEASQGMAVVSDTINSIRSVSEEVEKTANTIQGLEKNTEKMGSILDVIKGVAEQTNLLALNAAIEAARAGEQGRGFAVVADEVRTLASRTQESTQEIHEMIEQLQNGTQSAVSVMNRSKEQAEKSVLQSSKADESLKSINEAVNTILDMNTNIAVSVDAQSSVVDNINHNIVSVNQVAEETVQGAEQTATSSEELAKLANHLQSMVERFKVS